MADDRQEGPGRSGRSWLARMPDRVAAQRELLELLLDAAEAQATFRWLELGGSLARDAGDELSDIDAGLGIADDDWPAAITAAQAVIRRAGPVSEEFRQPHPGRDGQTAWHLFTLQESGLQLSLVVMPSSWRAGLPPGSVALYDADGQLARPWMPQAAQASPEQAREWACLGWLALGDLAKYLDRGSVWEAHARLEEAREQVWRLWALASGAVYPEFGLTTVLDAPGCALPDGIGATAAALDPGELLDAAIATSEVLAESTRRALRFVSFESPVGLPAWTRSRLASVRRA